MKEKVKCYIYTRVSTAMQIDGYSLDAQKIKMKAFCDYNEYEIAGEYEDAGKSGKSIEGRVSFNQMMEDIKSGKDGVSYVLVFKLSRFGRNAADVLATLQVMQDFGVNLICVEDGIDSSKDAGKLMISVLSAVAEIERENIRVQTMEGRMQKAREGKWNGGFAPYGYSLIDGKLEVNEEEAVAIRMIFDQYVNTDLGANGIAKYLENHGIHKIARQNGKNPLFDAALIRRIIQNPVYSGKISYGRRRTEKVHGTRNEYRQVRKEDYLLVDGLHEALVSEEVWEQAQVKVAAQAKKYEKVNRDKREKIHLLSGILKCPVCGAGMYGNKSIKKRKDGSNYKDFYYYGCKHRNMTRGHKCDYKKQVYEEMLDASVAEVISKLVSDPKFSDLIRNKINMEVDTVAKDSIEMQTAELLAGSDGAFVYKFITTDKYKKLKLHIYRYESGKLSDQDKVEMEFEDSGSPKSGEIVMVPDFDNYVIKLIISGDGNKLSTEIPILENVEDREYYGRTATEIKNVVDVKYNEHQPLIAFVYDNDEMSVPTLDDFINSQIDFLSKNDYVYYVAFEFCK